MLRYLPLALLLACLDASASSPRPLRVVATTSIVGDIVRAVGGEDIQLTTLLGPGMDPHTFEPAPRDAAEIARANLLFLNGGGLETFMDPLLTANRQTSVIVVDLCEGLPLVHREEEHEHGETEAAEPEAEHHHHHDHGALDPHVWFDPMLVARWTEAIAHHLGDRDPERASLYQERAAAYRAELETLDRWIKAEADSIPAGQRRFVTDHNEFGYFADRYGFAITGALLPNVSTATETSAKELAALESSIRTSGTRVLIVGNSVNPSLAQRVARDTGLTVVTLYTGALSKSGEPAATYLTFMRYNVEALFQALKKTAP